MRRHPKRPVPKGASVRRELTPDEARQVAGAREEETTPEAMAEARASLKSVFKALDDAERALDEAMALLREERDRQGVSLADIQERTGIARSQLCALENAEAPNPTIATVCRVADALGMRVVIRLAKVERPAAKPARKRVKKPV